MKLFSKLTAILFLCAYFLGCISKENTIHVDTIESKDLLHAGRLKFDDKNYFAETTFIKLETTEESIISEITQIDFSDDLIFIFDSRQSKIMVFNLKGEFLYNIGKQGQGPEEFGSISAFYINPYTNTIDMIDPINMSVLSYGISGNFIKRITHKNSTLSFARQIVPINKEELFCYFATNWEDNSLYAIIDNSDFSTKKVIEQYAGHSDNYISYTHANHPFTFFDNKISFGRMYVDNIYKYENGITSPCIAISERKEIPNKILKQRLAEAGNNNSIVLSNLLIEDKYATGIMNIFENGSFIVYDFKSKQSSINAVIWNKKEKKGVFIDEYLHASPDFAFFKSSHENTLVRIWQSDAILAFKDELQKNEIQYPESVKKLVSDFEEDDNPVLIFYKLKE